MATKTYRITEVGEGNASVTINATAGQHSAPAWANIGVTCAVPPAGVYGVYWNGESTEYLTRIDNGAGLPEPEPALSSGNGSSPFDTVSPWKDIKKINDSTVGELVEIPKFYYKLSQDDDTGNNGIKIQICDNSHSAYALSHGYSVSPAHMNRGDGSGERSVVYIGAYACNGDYKSLTDSTPISNLTSRATSRTAIHNLGSTIWQVDFAMMFTINLLYLVEYARWNPQKVIGMGGTSGGRVTKTGLTDSMTYHTGTTASTRIANQSTSFGNVRYRYMEDLWNNVFFFCDGVRYDSNKDLYLIKNPSEFSDSQNGVKIADNYMIMGSPSSYNIITPTNYYPIMLPDNDGNTDAPKWYFTIADSNQIFTGGNPTSTYGEHKFASLGHTLGQSSWSGYMGGRIMKLP